MRKVLGITTLLLLAFGVALAQQDATQRDSDQSGMSPQSGQKTMPLRGCLSSSDDHFVLTTQDGKTVKVEGDAAKLKEHVGHTVELNGKMSGAENPASPSASEPTITVDSVTHVSASCEKRGGSAAEPKGAEQPPKNN
jgi:hypothetical protein